MTRRSQTSPVSTPALRRAAALALSAATLCLAVAPAFAAPPDLPEPSLQTLHHDFLTPPNAARPMVRWWWFGLAVVKPEILRELQQMKADGIQGAELAFEYPQVLNDPTKGLDNLPFLSPEMLDDVKYAQEEGRKLGLRIDLTLCSGWPYGGPATPLAQAVGRLRTAEVPIAPNAASVTAPTLSEGESYISASIAYVVPRTAAEESEEPAGRFRRGRRNAGPPPPNWSADTARPLAIATAAPGSSIEITPAPAPRVALFFISSHTKQEVKRSAVGAEGYVLDPFSHAAVSDYLQKVGTPLIGAFGNTPPYAIFSDSLEAYGASWTPDLPAEFLKRRGYDLIPHLAELVGGDSPEAETVRHDFGETLTELINQNYLVQMTDWAVAHHTKFRSQTYGTPAVDFSSQNLVSLAEGEGPQWRAFSTLRWATSANHVFGHDVSSGETFTWLHSPVFRAIPLDMKAEADIDFIMGENLIFGHGWPYSPPDHEVPEPGWSLYAATSLNDHNPWNPVMPAVTAYIGRLSYLMSQGQPANQVAILLPTDDAWASFTPAQTSVTAAMQRLISPELMSAILSAGYNADFIDAKAIQSVGLGSHQVLVLPPTDRIPVGALHAIAAFAAAGGKVISVGHLPSLNPEGTPLSKIQGADTSEIALVPDDAALGQALHNAAAPDFNLTAGDQDARSQLGFIRRKLDSADVYLVVNTGNMPIQATAAFATRFKSGEEWDPDTGETVATSARLNPGSISFSLAPYGARVFVFSASAHPEVAPHGPSVQLADLSDNWHVSFPGLDKSLTETSPTDWIADPSTEHYSGVGIYTRDFTLARAPASPVFLEVSGGKPLPGAPNLPPDHADLGPNGIPNPLITRPGPGMHAFYDPPIRAAALVTINGRPAGALWHPPYRLDVSHLLKAGRNHIEIQVYNTALNAWSALPPHNYAPLIAKYGDRFQMQDLNKVVPIPSGLLGPVHLVTTETK